MKTKYHIIKKTKKPRWESSKSAISTGLKFYLKIHTFDKILRIQYNKKEACIGFEINNYFRRVFSLTKAKISQKHNIIIHIVVRFVNQLSEIVE